MTEVATAEVETTAEAPETVADSPVETDLDALGKEVAAMKRMTPTPVGNICRIDFS